MLGCVLNFPITEVPEIMKYEDCNVAYVYFHINITFSTYLPRLLYTIPCQFLLGPSMRVGAALEPLDLRHHLNSSLPAPLHGCGRVRYLNNFFVWVFEWIYSNFSFTFKMSKRKQPRLGQLGLSLWLFNILYGSSVVVVPV